MKHKLLSLFVAALVCSAMMFAQEPEVINTWVNDELAVDQEWVSGTAYPTFDFNEYISCGTTGGDNGVFYETYKNLGDWRIYRGRGEGDGKFWLAAKNAKINRVSFTYCGASVAKGGGLLSKVPGTGLTDSIASDSILVFETPVDSVILYAGTSNSEDAGQKVSAQLRIQRFFIEYTITTTPAVGVRFWDATSGLKFEITAIGKTNTIKVIGNSYTGTSYIIPASVTYNEVNFTVTEIGEYAFYKCTGLTSVTIGNSVTTIGDQAFYGCSNLTKVEINSNAYLSQNFNSNDNQRPSNMFGSQVTEYVIGNSVTTIGKDAFYYCKGLTSIDVDAANTHYCSIDGVLFNYAKDTLIQYPIGNTRTEYMIPNSVTTIGDGAFFYCRGLTSITIPNSVTTIGVRAFDWCEGWTSINVDAANTHYCSIDGVLFNYAKDTLIQYPIGNTRTEYMIPNSVTTIGAYAFRRSGLTSITIPNSVTTIGGHAFSSCDGLTSVTIGNSVTTIEDYAFCNCYGLTSITIPNSVTTIGEYAFDYCFRLTSVTIPNSVTTIGDYAFGSCTGLTSPVYNATIFAYMPHSYSGAYTIPTGIEQIAGGAFNSCRLTSVTIPNFVTTIGNSAFAWCDSLTFVTIPNSVTTIGEWAFRGSGLTSITIPNSVTTIGGSAFRDCSGLTSVTIGNSVTTIGELAFHFCSGLLAITSFAINPPLCGNDCFYKIDKSIPVYVPFNSVNAYKQAEGWKEFANLQRNPYDYATVSCSTTNGTISGAGKFIKGDTCTLTVTPNYGYHFVQWNDNITDNPRVFVVAQDTSFTAQIDINQYQLTVQSLDSTKGTVIGSGYYDYKFQPTISAIPKEHYHFLQWNDGSPVNPRKFTITQDTTFVAEFAPNNYQVTVTSADSNMGSCLGSGSFVYLSEQSISAKANYGYHFIQWNDGVTDNPRTIQVLSDTTFTAIFAKNIYTISTQAEHGSISGGGEYEYHSSVQLTATADEHYHFVRWSDGVTANPRTITVEGDKTYTAIFSIDQHTISAYAEHGRVIGTGTYDYGTEATLTVIPDFCYEFIGWSDSNTDNPRQVVVVADAQYDSRCELIKIASGTCGDNLTWSLNLQTGVLTISGYGAMTNYTASDQTPWYPYLSYTTFSGLNIENGVTHIGNYAFSGYSNLAAVTIPNSVTNIGESAFENCTHLANVTLGANLSQIGCNAFRGDFLIEEITIFAEFTPDVCSSTFDGISKQYVYLYVPENSIRKYQVDPNWNEFDIQIKSADVKPMDDENPVVTPTDQDVTITWPITDGTDTYTLTISKNGETVCVLTFNANGQLTNIAFAAPGHNGARQAPAATLTAQGYQFTVTGLNPGTAYNYSVTATDAGGQTLAEHKGNFSTTGGESDLQNVRNGVKATKYFYNGNLIIERNGIKYTATGQRVK